MCPPSPVTRSLLKVGSSNIYTRRVLAGEFQIVCPWLLRELVDLKLWDDQMKNMIIANNGSIQSIHGIPDDVKAIYKTVWEISQKKVLDLAADRGAFICQSQSLNVHLQSPTIAQLTSMHFYGWKKGLKTGMYYLRTRPAAQAIQFTVDQTMLKESMKARDQKTQPVGLSRTNGSSSASSAPSTPVKTPALVNGNGFATPVSIKQEPVTPDLKASQPSENGATSESIADKLASLNLNDQQKKAAEEDPEYAAALIRQKEREYEEAKLMCSLENKEACLMCSG